MLKWHWTTFIGVNNNAIVVQEVTEDEIVSEIFMEGNGASGDDVTLEGEKDANDGDEENVISYRNSQHGAKSSALRNDQERCSRPCVGEQ
jgi:dihydroxyacetone kinase-like predicted kinase